MSGFCHVCGHFGTLNAVTAWCPACTDSWFREMQEKESAA